MEQRAARSAQPLGRLAHVYRIACMALSIGLVAGCNPYRDGLFKTNFDARHDAFVRDLHAWVGRPFRHTCLSEPKLPCPSTTLPSGLIRYTLGNIGIYAGCTWWYDVDPRTELVANVGFDGDKRRCWNRGD